MQAILYNGYKILVDVDIEDILAQAKCLFASLTIYTRIIL